MTGALATYLRHRVAGMTLGIWLVVTALLQALDLLQATGDILNRKLGTAGVLHYALLAAPSEFLLGLPLAALLGPLLAFYALSRSREIMAVRASGISLRKLTLWILPVAILFAAFHFVLADAIVPHTESAMTQWWHASQPPPAKAPGIRWVRTSNALISVKQVSANAHDLRGITVFQRSSNGILDARWSARAAHWDGHAWQLTTVQYMQIASHSLHRTQTRHGIWQGAGFTPKDLLRLDENQPHLSGDTLLGVIAGRKIGAQPPSYYRMALLSLFANPLGILVLLLVTVPVCRTAIRADGGGRMLVVALVLGLAYVLCNGLLSAMGSAGRLAPIAAAVLPLLIFTFIGLAALQRADRI